MSEAAVSGPGVPGVSEWSVRAAEASDARAVAAAVAELLIELGGEGPERRRLEAEARRLVEEPGQGVILVAEATQGEGGQEGGGDTAAAPERELVGVLAASWQRALHVPGRYATVQDLWVSPAWRSAGVGAGLVDALVSIARERGVPRLEVGLPRESFAALARTEAFYAENGFEPLGPRMRRVLR